MAGRDFELWQPLAALAAFIQDAGADPSNIVIDPGAPVLLWVSFRVRRAVSRFNFYLRLGYQGPGRGLGSRLLRRAARTRLMLNFFGLDLERRAVEHLKRVAASFDPQKRGATKD